MYTAAPKSTKSKTLRNSFVDSASESQSSTGEYLSQETPDYDIHVDIADEDMFLASLGCNSLDVFLASIELRFNKWSYRLLQNDVVQSQTYYSGEAFTVDSSDGQVLMWNLMESATQPSVSIPFGAIGPNYRYTRNASVVNFGFGYQENRVAYFSSCINCYTQGGSVSFRWHCYANED